MSRLFSVNLGGGSGGSGANFRAGTQAITNGSATVSITFSSVVSATTYSINYSVVNSTDTDPIYLQGIVTAKSVSGFTITFNAPADSANYVVLYEVNDYA